MRKFSALVPLLFTRLGRRTLSGALVRAAAPVLFAGARLRRRTLRHAPLVAVVGSFGKTTTSRAVRTALGVGPDGQRASSAPFAALHLLRRGRSGRALVLEVAISRPGQMRAAAAAFCPDLVIVTSIGSEHLNSFRTLEALRSEKVAMIRALRPGGTAILNGDDPNVLWMAGSAPGRVVTFGYGESCDVRADAALLDGEGRTRLVVWIGGMATPVTLRLLGRRTAYAALAALAVARELAIAPPLAAARLAGLAPATGRLEPVPTPSGALVLRDDFKSSYETILAALEVLAALPARRRIVVLGEITEPPSPQRQHYRRVGERVAKVADLLVGVGSQTRTYRSGAIAAGMPPGAIVDGGRSVESARKRLPADLGPGDVVLIKGRRRQRLGRLALALAGRVVRCRLETCTMILTDCHGCPRLERGWGEVPAESGVTGDRRQPR
jgi:UDP-N-acetylmuramyl pentapeptide synthase